MDEDTRRRCIEPFFTTKGERGTGLGLASVYGMLQRHSAALEVDSEPGKGTTMRMIFPAFADGRRDARLATCRAREPEKAAHPGDRRRSHPDPLAARSAGGRRTRGRDRARRRGGHRGVHGRARRAPNGSSKWCSPISACRGSMAARWRQRSSKSSPTTPIILLTGWGQRLLDEATLPENIDRVLSKPPRLSQLRTALIELASPRDPGL